MNLPVTYSSRRKKILMDELIAKLNALKGRTIDENTIAELMRGSVDEATGPIQQTHRQGFVDTGVDSVDDLIVASRAAELELQSLRRYFTTNKQGSLVGVDGLADEELSSDSEDESIQQKYEGEKSYLDEVLGRNSMVTIQDDEKDETSTTEPVNDSIIASECLDSLPTSVIVPAGSCFIDLGKILSLVDGMFIIGTKPLEELLAGTGDNSSSAPPAACDVETLVFLTGTDPLVVIGVVVDTLGTVENPYHLVLITQPEYRTNPSILGGMIGQSVCTLDTHANVVELDHQIGGVCIRGAPQICGPDEDQCDEDSD